MQKKVASLMGAAGFLASSAVAQNLTGTVVADDTGAPLTGATVVVTQRISSASQRPAVYKAAIDSAGRYAVQVSPGQYQLCVHTAGLYLDPCQWGGAATRSVPATGAVSVPLRLHKGAWFLVRVHDSKGVLRQVEVVRGSAVSAFVTGAGARQFPLPVVYDNGRIRDYGAVVPTNLPMRVSVNGAHVLLADRSGAPPSPQGIPVQVPPAAISSAPPAAGAGISMFRRPTVKTVHIYATGRR